MTGGVTQVRAVTTALTMAGQGEQDEQYLLVGHVTKHDAIAGPRTLEHLVDVVLQIRGESKEARHYASYAASTTASAAPTRSAASSCTTTESSASPTRRDCSSTSGPTPVLGHRGDGHAGRQAAADRRGAGADRLGVERHPAARGQRHRLGSRAAMITAVLEKRAQPPVGQNDIYLSTVGGMRLTDPSSDLAVALAIASALHRPPDAHRRRWPSARSVSRAICAGSTGMDRRLAEAARLGFTCAVVPPGVKDAPAGLRGASRPTTSRTALRVLTQDRRTTQ